ncbi:MAG: O-antigen ligase family protein [Lachnospiraceae bacterium]|jgi:O-antigen ligase|nr:O-antigen ligase family protein [Lachnospiraceae bacterium]
MEKFKDRHEKINSKLIALFLYQYSLLIPIMKYLNPTILVSISGIIIVVILFLYNNRSPINLKVIFALCIITLCLAMNILLAHARLYGIFTFLAILFPVSLMFVFPFDNRMFIHTCCTLATLNFFVLCFIPFLGEYEYMRFGYGMLLSAVFFYIRLVYGDKLHINKKRQNKVGDALLLLASLSEMGIYGARGALLSFGLLFMIDWFIINKHRIFRNGLFLITVIFIYTQIGNILTIIELMLQRLGIFSYAIKKFRMQFESGIFAASSGRTKLYKAAIDKIIDHPWLGNGLDVAEKDGLYVHNLFLQVGQDFGIPAMLFLIIFLILILSYINSKKVSLEVKIVYEVLFAISIGRLMVSSVLWRRPEFWMLVFLYLTKKRTGRMVIEEHNRILE